MSRIWKKSFLFTFILMSFLSFGQDNPVIANNPSLNANVLNQSVKSNPYVPSNYINTSTFQGIVEEVQQNNVLLNPGDIISLSAFNGFNELFLNNVNPFSLVGYQVFYPHIDTGDLSTNIYIQNLGNSGLCNIILHFINLAGDFIFSYEDTIQSNSSKSYNPELIGVSTGFQGSMMSESSCPLIGVVTLTKTSTNSVLSYTGITEGSFESYLSDIVKNLDGKSSEIWVQNAGNSSVDVSLTFFPTDGGTSYTVDASIPPYSSHNFRTMEMGISDNSTGWVLLTSDISIVAIAEEWDTESNDAAAYEGEFYGSNSLYSARQIKNIDGLYSRTQILNISGTSANIVINFYNLDGTHAYTVNQNLLSNESFNLNLEDYSEIAQGFNGSIMIEANQPIIGVSSLYGNKQADIDAFAQYRVKNIFPTDILLFPSLTKNFEEGKSSEFSFINTMVSIVQVTITFFDQNGVMTTQISDSIPSMGIGRYSTDDISELGDAWKGYAFVVADGGGQLIPGETLQITKYKIPDIDIGFRPNPDGYKFSNWMGDLRETDFTINDMRRMFGDQAVCLNSQCSELNPVAEKWYEVVTNGLSGGRCEGMSSTSLRFFTNIDEPEDFQAGAYATYSLDKINARSNISYYQVLGYSSSLQCARRIALPATPKQVISQLYSAFGNGSLELPVLVISTHDQNSHALVPYALKTLTSDSWEIDVYDPNFKNDSSRKLFINNNHWTYNGTPYQGGTDIPGSFIYVLPLQTYDPDQSGKCDWCGVECQSDIILAQTFLEGSGHLLITNSKGDRLGYEGTQFVSEIPEAFGSKPPSESEILSEPIYYTPITDTYTILLDGQTLTQTAQTSVFQFGPGYSTGIENTNLNQFNNAVLVISPDGKELSYRPSITNDTSMIQANSEDGTGYRFIIDNITVGSGQIITMTMTSDQLILNNSQNQASDYDIEITRFVNGQSQLFTHLGIPIGLGDTHFLDYGTWDGYGSLILDIDYGSDGTIDDTIILNNSLPKIYLPIVKK